MNKKIDYPIIVLVEGVLLENGEVIHYGKSLGFINKKQKKLVEAGATKYPRGNEPVVAVAGDKVA